MKNCIHTSKLGLLVEFCGDFFLWLDIDIHHLNLRPSKSLKFLVEISLKNMCYFIFFPTIKAK